VRRQLLKAICEAEGGQATVAMLCTLTGLDRTLVSPNLKPLRMLGLIVSRQQGTYRWYTAVPNRVRLETLGDRHGLTVFNPDGSGVMFFEPVKAAAVPAVLTPPKGIDAAGSTD
jgi:DNA-binding transcriptional ArsR family regulator